MDIIDTLKKDPRWCDNPASAFDLAKDRWGILFLNMGGPENTTGVHDYLQNIFEDPDIIKLPLSFLLQKPLARVIASRRTEKVIERYNLIGGGSPLIKWSQAVADGVNENLLGEYPRIRTAIGMRYTSPFINSALDELNQKGCRFILIIPLYPHYSRVTTGTALKQVIKWLSKNKSECRLKVIWDWHDNREYVSLLRQYINTSMSSLNKSDETRLMFSAHAVPVKLAQGGDPYVKQIETTARLAGEGFNYILSYQSRTGPVKWVEPDSKDMVNKYGQEGIKNLVVVPLSFVSDHIETLYELDIELKEIAHSAGIENFIRVPAFNDDPEFINMLADFVRAHIKSEGNAT